MTRHTGFLLIACAALLACHKAPPAAAPAPAPAVNVDSIARAEQARRAAAARADQVRRDSIAHTEAVRHDAAALAEAQRRATAEAAATTALLAPVFFDFDSDAMRPDAMSALDAKATVLRDYASVRIRIAGHTDSRGSDQYNLVLGQRRSAAARRYLVARGVLDSRIASVSFGEQRPACAEDTEPCWQQNRRDAFEIIAGSIVSAATPKGRDE
jgi:peptidoglycan-associated lipoprotein